MQCGLGSSEIQSGSTCGSLNLQGWALSSLCSDACRPRGCLICASATSYEINTNNEQQNRAITAGHFEFMWARSEMLMVSGPQKTKGPETPGSKAVDKGAALTLAFRVKVLCWFCPHRPECAHKQFHRHTVNPWFVNPCKAGNGCGGAHLQLQLSEGRGRWVSVSPRPAWST